MTADPSAVLRALRVFWASQGVRTGAPASAAEVAAHEQSYRVRFPPDVRAYFREINGMERHPNVHWDEDQVHFYPLEKFIPLDVEWPESKVASAPDLFVFADFLVWSHGYAVRLRPESAAGELHIVWGDSVCVEGSFTDFLRRYLARDGSVIYGP